MWSEKGIISEIKVARRNVKGEIMDKVWVRVLALVILVCVVILAGFLPTIVNSAYQKKTNAEFWDTDGDGILEILAIGNSFSVDALQYACEIARDLGIKDIVIGNLYIGGCSLATHLNNAYEDNGAYTYFYNDKGTWKSTANYKMSTAIKSRTWDLISLQQQSNISGIAEVYGRDLEPMIDYVKNIINDENNVNRTPNAKLAWHMTWAYQQDSTHTAFANYNNDQMTMYSAIVSAVESEVATNPNIQIIIPTGTAVQNSRTSKLGDTTTRDGYHLSLDYGRYLAGLMFIKVVTGLEIDDITYKPDGVDEQEKQIAIESVNNAHENPFVITMSQYI